MANINISICDSDLKICEDIFNLIRAELPEAKISVFKSKDELLESKTNFEIYFLDIKGIDGLDVAKILRRREFFLQKSPSILIFITGYENFMSEAFDVHAFHYLLKPVDAKKFSQVLNQAISEVQNFQTQAEKFLLIKVEGVTKKILLKDIFYVESDNKKVIFHTTEKIFTTYGKMDSLEIALGESFFRCHRFYLVNFEKISAYSSTTIQLVNGEKIFMAEKRYADFVKKFLKYAQVGGVVNIF